MIALGYYEKLFLFHLKNFFRSQDIKSSAFLPSFSFCRAIAGEND